MTVFNPYADSIRSDPLGGLVPNPQPPNPTPRQRNVTLTLTSLALVRYEKLGEVVESSRRKAPPKPPRPTHLMRPKHLGGDNSRAPKSAAGRAGSIKVRHARMLAAAAERAEDSASAYERGASLGRDHERELAESGRDLFMTALSGSASALEA